MDNASPHNAIPREEYLLEDGPEPSRLELTFGMVKPHAVAEGKAAAIKDWLEERGFEIVYQRRQALLSERLARAHYREHASKPFFPDLIAKTANSPVDLLLIAREDAVNELVSVVGATDPKKAGEGTLRHRFGTGFKQNAFHRADSHESAYREIFLYFTDPEIRKAWPPAYAARGIDPIDVAEGNLPIAQRDLLEPALLVVKPRAYDRREEIEERLRCAGLRIAAKREHTIPLDLARAQYRDLTRGRRDTEAAALAGDAAAYVVLAQDAPARLSALAGHDDPARAEPGTLRADFGNPRYRFENGVYVSADVRRDISLHFPGRLPWQIADRLPRAR